MDGANRLLDAAEEVQSFCRANGWRFCFIGGIAVQHRGEARLTRDADLTVYPGMDGDAGYIDKLLTDFRPRMADARQFARDHRVLLLRASNDIPLNVTFGALPFEDKAVSSARTVEVVAGVQLQLCSPGALVVFKVFADRPQDRLDVEGIVAKSASSIDWNEVRADLTELRQLKGDTSALGRLDEVPARHSIRQRIDLPSAMRDGRRIVTSAARAVRRHPPTATTAPHCPRPQRC